MESLYNNSNLINNSKIPKQNNNRMNNKKKVLNNKISYSLNKLETHIFQKP
jgi:hypothetical protein